MIDGNTYVLNKHLEKQEQQEKFESMFIDDIDDDLVEIQSIIKALRKKASDYYGYDFSEILCDCLSDLI